MDKIIYFYETIMGEVTSNDLPTIFEGVVGAIMYGYNPDSAARKFGTSGEPIAVGPVRLPVSYDATPKQQLA